MIECLDALCGNAFDGALDALDEPDRKQVTGTRIPRGFVRWVIQNEWVRCLADLVERRLMLVLTGQLSVETLQELAQLLVEEGLLEAASLEPEVAACQARLTEQYGYRW
jgi:glycerol-3-phosphate dehydrogenase